MAPVGFFETFFSAGSGLGASFIAPVGFFETFFSAAAGSGTVLGAGFLCEDLDRLLSLLCE